VLIRLGAHHLVADDPTMAYELGSMREGSVNAATLDRKTTLVLMCGLPAASRQREPPHRHDQLDRQHRQKHARSAGS
jgi:hypothetical protein